MRRFLIYCVVMGMVVVGASAQEVPSRDLSQYRTVGIGLQAPCVISLRVWLIENFALEANAFVVSMGGFTSGCAAGKVLVKLADTDIFDFYTVFEANLHIGNYWVGGVADIALKGGMELSILPSLAINLEFGEAFFFGPDGAGATPAVSLGIHYYFVRTPPAQP
jgi:hypothetical protein